LDLGQRWAAAGREGDVAAYQGRDASGRVRVAQVAVHQAGRWLIAGLHLSGPIPDVPAGQR
jgi:hypothetical protein